MYELLGISLGLAALLTVNAVASLAGAGACRLIKAPLQRCSARTRAEFLFAFRVAPLLLSTMFVAGFLIPAYLLHEPYGTNEVVSGKLATLALISAIGVLLAVSRGVRSWLATRRLLRAWIEAATPTVLAGVSIPTFKLTHEFPVLAVVGTLRPRLFVAEQLLATLAPDELQAAIAHEAGHLSARDNLKRSMLRACGDALLMIPCGLSLDRAWADTSESAADEYAARTSSSAAVNLAAALVKVARMVPKGSRAAVPVAAFLVGNEEDRGIKARVRRLLELASNQEMRNRTVMRYRLLLPLALLVMPLATIVVHHTNSEILASLHLLIEHTVHLLS
ncbi:MAG TPA: M48 family metalloprotease [Pyrinomonadaceae bacterium]|nr:M48 family metalloprotease [Pyrinomonadaceae bacterium]